MIIYEAPGAAAHIPIVDFNGASSDDLADREAVARQIFVACRQSGFFYITGHGIPTTTVDRIFTQARLFFDLSPESKLALHMRNSPSSAGYEPMGAQRLDSQDETTPAAPADLKESFYVCRELPVEHPMVERRSRGYGYNQWPDGLDDFKTTLVDYYLTMCDLGDRVLAMLALSLGLSETWFGGAFTLPSATLRLIKYPPHPAAAAFNQLGAGAHTDWGGITLLAQDSSGGLEVCTAAGDWIEAPPVPGAFVVNLGDLTARWTNGAYASNLHRVKTVRSSQDRYSIPFFYSPHPDALIEPIPGTVDDEHPRRFATCTAAEHMLEMFERSYGYRPGATS